MSSQFCAIRRNKAKSAAIFVDFAPSRPAYSYSGSAPSSRRRRRSSAPHLICSSPVFLQKQIRPAQRPVLFAWCGQQDSNLHALAGEPKSPESTNSTMPAWGYSSILSGNCQPKIIFTIKKTTDSFPHIRLPGGQNNIQKALKKLLIHASIRQMGTICKRR